MLFTLRRAWRSLTRAPLVSCAIVVCLALGVGPTTTVFNWTEHLVRRPLPAVESIDRVTSIVTLAEGREDSVSYPDYIDWRNAATTISGLAAFGLAQFGVRGAAEPVDATQSTWGVVVSDNYFDVLGIRAAAGRTFLPGESSVAGAAPHAVVSDAFARRRFGDPASALGQVVRVNDVLVTVIGVAPSNFSGTFAGLAFDLWIPVTMHPMLTGDGDVLIARERRWLQTIGRLRQGVELAEARTELQAVSRRLAEIHPENRGREAFVKRLDTGAARRLETLFTILLGVTAFVGLLVCTNVANLLLLRGAGRRFEMGMALALGASRRQLVAQLMTEATMLAAAGGAAGLLLAWWSQGLLPALMPPSPLPIALDARSDVRTLLFALGVSSAMVLLFGLSPAIQTVRGAVLPSLSTLRGGTTRGAARLRGALVQVQLALSLAALASAGVFLRTNADLSAIDTGLHNPEEVVIVSTDLDQAGYHSQRERRDAATRLLSNVRAISDVRSAALATFVPLGFTGYSSVEARPPAYVPRPNESMRVLSNYVSPDYFRTVGVAIREGRAIDQRDTDGSPPVVIVNEAFAQAYMRDTVVIGSRIELGGAPFIVIGVAANGKYRFDALDEPSPPHVYLAYEQRSRAPVTLHIRANGSPATLLPQIRRAFANVSPALPLNNPTTLDEYTSLPLFPVRLGTAVLSSLGGIALLLASAGLYAVVAYRVTQRWKELAVRSALGASASRLMRLILGDGLRNAAGGLGLGLVLAFLAVRVIGSRLPRVSGVDPLVLLAAASVLAAVSLAAAVLPATRAWRVHPGSVLRGE